MASIRETVGVPRVERRRLVFGEGRDEQDDLFLFFFLSLFFSVWTGF
jgi:hypothetical protein